MLLTKKVVIYVKGRVIEWLKSKGYNITEQDINTKMEVNVEDLMPNSGAIIEVLCDYCKKNISTKRYADYTAHRHNIQKDCCNNPECMKKKREEANLLRYGNKNQFQREDIKERIKQFNIENYGVENTFQIDLYKEKQQQTMVEKYGVKHHSQTDEWLDKVKATSLINWGTEFPFQSEEIKEKLRQGNIDKYGVPYASQSLEIKEKAAKTLYLNITCMASKQQIYLWNLLGGELNYSDNTPNLDIAFPSEKVYIEYDGGGHKLNVLFHVMTEKEFDNRERKREYYLKKHGWKSIRIISRQDKLPDDDTIKELIKLSKEYLNTGHSWMYIDIDNNEIQCSQYKKEYKFENLRHIK